MRLPFALLAALLLALAACSQTTEDAAVEPEPSSTAVSTTARPLDRPAADPGAARVVEVVDGDTIDVAWDGTQERVRLVGINTPERGECLADEAAQRLRDLVDGREVALVPDRTDRDRFGRLLRHVEVDGTDVGGLLVQEGLALARRYPPDVARADAYEAKQRSARDAGVGLWADDACGAAAVDADVVIDAIRFDADGDDTLNLNDEWVRITNRGPSPMDLGGWVLKDTSASHRYAFPDAISLGRGASVTVRSGCGADTPTDLHWCNQGSAIWNNGGDTAFLLDPSGNIVDSRDG
jgi:micrococcal nuclease